MTYSHIFTASAHPAAQFTVRGEFLRVFLIHLQFYMVFDPMSNYPGKSGAGSVHLIVYLNVTARHAERAQVCGPRRRVRTRAPRSLRSAQEIENCSADPDDGIHFVATHLEAKYQ